MSLIKIIFITTKYRRTICAGVLLYFSDSSWTILGIVTPGRVVSIEPIT